MKVMTEHGLIPPVPKYAVLEKFDRKTDSRYLVPMQNHKKIVVVMPAYNAERTLRKTYDKVME